ncbi:hypothetical protein ACJIZ3_017363 [Penstemon smallii]|uniref:Uncharacterized protein n=1 Tax=Penstemon smallii TaxID=265156 RepID=A0ABD3SVB0_9LAMI
MASHNILSHNMLHHPNTTFINQQGAGFDFGELEEAIVMGGGGGGGVKNISNDDETKKRLYSTTIRPAAATLEMFPSFPLRFQHQTTIIGSSKSGEESTDSGSMISLNPSSDNQLQVGIEQKNHHLLQLQQEMASDSPTTKVSQAAKQNPEKTLRRLAQNREAAKKSRIRKKAYVQQLESSRIRLTQLEQELHRARSQGLFVGVGGVASGNITSGGAMFDMEYAKWLDDNHRQMSELRSALQAHLSDNDMRVVVDGCISHYDEIFRLKGVAAKSDVFHLITGMWATPAERCFLWMGGFRPSDLIKMLVDQLDPLTEQQLMGIYGLQQSSQQAEEALSQGLEQLQQSLVDTIAHGSINESIHHMALALGKLSNLEGFVRQADNLRQQMLHQLRRVLTVRQAARCFLVIGEYYGRLRALSSLWASRPRENLITDDNNSCQTTMDLHMVQSSQNQFLNF